MVTTWIFFGFVKQIFLENLTFAVPSLCARPMFFVLLVLVNGDVGDFHDDGSFTHGEPGARIFGGLRPQSCNAKKKHFMCSCSTGSNLDLSLFVAVVLPGTFEYI